ncbi:MAG TPA: alkaline phosphatase family protein, partial [Pseudolabrys sp.]
MKRSIALLALLAAGLPAAAVAAQTQGINAIETVVVIYAENRSFDNLYGSFPGANGLQNVTPESFTQIDRDGSEFKELP